MARRAVLEELGYVTEGTTDPRKAFEMFRKEPHDLVVTDYKMKGIDGMEVLRTVKDSYPATQVIMITAFANLDAAIEALRRDVHDFFPKPVKIKELKASIRRALDKQSS